MKTNKAGSIAGLGKLGFGGMELKAQGRQVGFNDQAGIDKEGEIALRQGNFLNIVQVRDAQRSFEFV